MDEILASTPLGRKYTVKAKLWQSTAVAAVIAFGTVLPHLWQVLRDYGLPSLLGPAMSISDLQAVPKFITLSDLLLFWLICRFAACLCMRITKILKSRFSCATVTNSIGARARGISYYDGVFSPIS